MIDVKHRKCKYDNCRTYPCFNYKQFTKGMYCAKHKMVGMINVVSSHCIEPGCTTQPSFNYQEIQKALYCAKHKKDEMIYVKKRKNIA
jgi:hypothetical protein